jgi:hypothetical protein
MSQQTANKVPTNTSTDSEDHESREPFYIYLQSSELNTNLQKYISSFVQHIAGILEKDEPNVRRIISFLPERNGNLFKINPYIKVYYCLGLDCRL